MRLTGPIVAAVALAVAGAPPAPALRLPLDVLLLSASGAPAATQRTQEGRPYTVRVTGVYSYNDAVGLSDCGHADPQGPESWQPRINVALDDNAALCFAQPFDKTHSYEWTQVGTGSPFVFRILTVGDDDSGDLIVTVR